MREGEKRWVACERHKDNGVVLKTDCPNSQDASVGASCMGEVHVEPERSPLTFQKHKMLTYLVYILAIVLLKTVHNGG